MSAARYVGRVGGLAAAMGAGAAILIGSGTASADSSAGTSPAGSAEATSGTQTASTAAQKTAKVNAHKHSRADRDPGKISGAAKPAKAKDDGTANAKDEAKADTKADTKTDTKADTKDTEVGDNAPAATTPAADTPAPPGTAVATEVVKEVVQDVPVTAKAAPATTPKGTGSTDALALASVVGTSSPPASPQPKVSATTSAVAALVMSTPVAPLATSPITADPEVKVTDGVITGTTGANDSRGYTLTYEITTGPDKGGQVTFDKTDGSFYYIPDSAVVNAKGTEKFTVTVTESTPQVEEALAYAASQSPEAEAWLSKLIVSLRNNNTVLGNALKPVIGYTKDVPIAIDIASVVPAGVAVAQNIVVTSFDGTKILTHFFPASNLAAYQKAPTILDGPGLAQAGDTDPYSVWSGFAGVGTLRANGYNVVTWDPRGEFGSGGVLHLDSPDYEGKDMSAIIDMVSTLSPAQLDKTGDPRLGMVGGSYGGGIQLVTATEDHRIDAIVPGIAWNSLLTSLYQDQDFKTVYAALLTLGLNSVGANIIPQLYTGLLSGALTGKLDQAHLDLLAASSPDISKITAPTLLIQGTVDTLFPLDEAMANAAELAGNGVPVKMLWFCGGHGACLSSPADPSPVIEKATLAWLARYVKKDATVDTGPTFEWIDQNGQYYSSNLLPTNPDFDGAPIVVTGGGGTIPISSDGGSGPQTLVPAPYSLTDAAKATSAVNIDIPAVSSTTDVLGPPVLTMTYSGTGNAKHVYAQIVDNKSGLVLGNLVTPVPVVLDGQSHTVQVPLEAIAYTLHPTDSLTLQITGSATAYLSVNSSGSLTVTGTQLSLPTVGAGAGAKPVVATV